MPLKSANSKSAQFCTECLVLVASPDISRVHGQRLPARRPLKSTFEDFFQPTTQPTECDVLYDLRGVWQSPFSSAITKDGHWLLANSESGKLFVVDVANGVLTKTFDIPDVPVLPTPGEFALTPDGTHAYVSCPQGGTIEILNLKDWKLEEPIRLTKGVDGMAWVPSVVSSAASDMR